MSTRTGLLLPVSRIDKILSAESPIKRKSRSCGIVVTSMVEKLLEELLTLAANERHDDKSSKANSRITPNHLIKGIKNDKEFNQLLGNVVFGGCGRQQPSCYLLPKRMTQKRVKVAEASE